MNNKHSIFLQNKDGIETRIEYVGTMKLLDLLIEKIKEEKDINNIKEYCLLYKDIYKLIDNEYTYLGSDKEWVEKKK